MKEFWKYFKENFKKIIKDLKDSDKEAKRKQIPNILTLIRGILAPITIIPAVITKNLYLAFTLIAICALTDCFDGWYARHKNAQSEFGAVLDAICDKLFVLTLAFPLVFTYTKWIIGILILELLIAIVNSTSRLKGYDPHSSILGKFKTAILDASIAIFYLDYIINIPNLIIEILVVLTNILQILCIVGYFITFRKQISAKKINTIAK